MNESQKKVVQGCAAACVGAAQIIMMGVVFIYAVTHW